MDTGSFAGSGDSLGTGGTRVFVDIGFWVVTCCCVGLEFNGDFECFEFDWLLSQMEIFSNFTSPREKGLEIELQNLNLGLGFGFCGLFFAGYHTSHDWLTRV